MKTDNLLIKNGDKQVVRITGGNSPRRKTDSRPRTLIVYGFLLPFGRYKFDNLLSSCVRLSRPSVTSQFCIETTGRIELVFRIDASSTYSTLCCKEIRVGLSLNAEGTSLWNFVPNSRLRPKNFRHGKSIVLSTKLVDDRAC